jgi:hypothetical protein
MPVKEPKYQGVYIEEIPSGVEITTEVASSVTVFLGRTPRGEVENPTLINSFADYQRLFGGLHADYPMSQAVSDHFASGGKQALIVRLSDAAVSFAANLDNRDELGTLFTSDGLKKLNWLLYNQSIKR